MRIAVVGLGKLGLPFAETMGHAHSVVGFDIAPPSMARIEVASALCQAAAQASVIFVVVPTPHGRGLDGSTPSSQVEPTDFSYEILETVLSDLASCTDDGQVIAIVSTVLPGTTRRQLAPRIRGHSVVYNPCFAAMGTVACDLQQPEMILLGSAEGTPDDWAVARVRDVYRSIAPGARVVVGTWEEAEATKVFYNTFISFKLAFVNMIQDVSQIVGHMNVDIVTQALAESHKRITSPAYMCSGMGDGGPCHPRDNIALSAMASRIHLGYDLFGAVMLARERQAKRLAEYLASLSRPVIILGRSYKPGVRFAEGSYSLLVAHFLAEVRIQCECLDEGEGEQMPQGMPVTYLLAHNAAWVLDYDFRHRAVVVDPWRRFRPSDASLRVVHYGNTRMKAQGVGSTQEC